MPESCHARRTMSGPCFCFFFPEQKEKKKPRGEEERQTNHTHTRGSVVNSQLHPRREVARRLIVCILIRHLPRCRERVVLLFIYSTRQMLRISHFWPDWISCVRLGVSHTMCSTKRSHSYFFPKISSLKFLIIRFLTSVAYDR